MLEHSSVREERRHCHVVEQVARHAAADPLAQARMAVAAAHDQVGADVGRARQELIGDASEIDLAVGFASDPMRLEPARGQAERIVAGRLPRISPTSTSRTRSARRSNGSAPRSALAASGVSFQATRTV